MKLEERVEKLDRAIQLAKINPCHVKSGPQGGQFCETKGGGTGTPAGSAGKPSGKPLGDKGSIRTDSEGYATATTPAAFERHVKRMGWDNTAQFEHDTGVSAKELIGKPFTVIHDRVYEK